MAAVSTVLFAPIGALSQEDDVSNFINAEADVDRWIRLESQIAGAENAWKTEKATLESGIKLLETEEATLRRNLDANRLASERFTSNRNRIASELDQRRAALEGLDGPLAELDQEIRQLYPNLPEPLRRQLDGYLDKLKPGDDGAPVSIATRSQALVGALSAIERFGNTLTLSRETRPGPDGTQVSARVLYWGLAIGYAIDDTNGRAWIVAPSERGWDWTERSESFDSIATLLASYGDGGEDPQLVFLPASAR